MLRSVRLREFGVTIVNRGCRGGSAYEAELTVPDNLVRQPTSNSIRSPTVKNLMCFILPYEHKSQTEGSEFYFRHASAIITECYLHFTILFVNSVVQEVICRVHIRCQKHVTSHVISTHFL